MTAQALKKRTLNKTTNLTDTNIGSTKYPKQRMRRLRKTEAMRNLVQENTLSINDLILPIFVEENANERQAIPSLPGIFRETETTLKDAVKTAEQSGIKAISLFGVSHNKDFEGTDSLKKDGLMYRMISTAREAAPSLLIIADACFCEYTTHGHCGPLDHKNNVNNDRTLDNLVKQSIIAADAGADIIAPSGMMDGAVGAIRQALDQSGHENIAILSYAAKFASHFYGPFRDAAGCALGENQLAPSNRKTYQMNPANGNEALREVALDIKEGADMVMIKPGSLYMDIIFRVKQSFNVPTLTYHVSGEYAMLKAAAEKGWLNYESCLMETMLSFKRAGCDAIFTYAALDCARVLTNQK